MVLAATKNERGWAGGVIRGERGVFRGFGLRGASVRRHREHVRTGTALPVILLQSFSGRAAWCLEAPLLTVGNNAAGVEELLGNGLLSCPCCGGRLGGHG